jgi:hypothetical protein
MQAVKLKKAAQRAQKRITADDVLLHSRSAVALSESVAIATRSASVPSLAETMGLASCNLIVHQNS